MTFSEVGEAGIVETAKEWQDLIGACMALAAALLATYPIYRQLDLLNQQAAANAITAILWAAQALDDEFSALEKDYMVFSKLKWLISRSFKSQPETWSGDFLELISLIEAARVRSLTYNERDPESDEIFKIRRDFSSSCLEIMPHLSNIFTCGSPKENPSPEEIGYKEKAEDALGIWENTRRALLEKVRSERRAYWARVRSLERAALGLPRK